MRNFTVARGRWGRPRKQDGGSPMSENKTSENKPITRSAAAGRRCAPDSKKANRATRIDRARKNRPALPVEALNDKVVVTIDGERGEISKREAVATGLADKIDRCRFARDQTAVGSSPATGSGGSSRRGCRPGARRCPSSRRPRRAGLPARDLGRRGGVRAGWT